MENVHERDDPQHANIKYENDIDLRNRPTKVHRHIRPN